MTAFLLALLAGLLTTLSPCVLPVLPFVLGGAIQRQRSQALLLGAGLMISFTAFGILIAVFGNIAGLSPEIVRRGAALLLVVFGMFMVFPTAQEWFQRNLAPIARLGQGFNQSQSQERPWTPLLMGASLGLVWSPCAGPTLGLASALAAQGTLLKAMAIMLTFSFGAIVPLIGVSLVSQQAFRRFRDRWFGLSHWFKPAFGVVAVVAGLMLFWQLEKPLEARLLDLLPDFWINLITKF